MKIKPTKITDDGYYFDLEQFKTLFDDLSKIKYYKYETVNDENNLCILITFYDEDENVVSVKRGDVE